VKKHAVQCGFGTPGILMSTQALLNKNPAPTSAEISKAIAGNLCRCTGYHHIFASIAEAAHTRKEPT
jgi:carbon-monoxide dehydrogenase small subunit